MPAYAFLGNLSVQEIEGRYGFRFTGKEREYMEAHWHQNAEFASGESGWHMFDLPELLVLSDDEVGRHVLDILVAHNDRGEIHGSFEAAFDHS